MRGKTRNIECFFKVFGNIVAKRIYELMLLNESGEIYLNDIKELFKYEQEKKYF